MTNTEKSQLRKPSKMISIDTYLQQHKDCNYYGKRIGEGGKLETRWCKTVEEAIEAKCDYMESKET